MKKAGVIFMCVFIISILSCDKEDSEELSEAGETPLVINVYDYKNDLVAHYEYDENDLLINRGFTDPVNNISSDLIFHYKDGLVDVIEFVEHDFPQSSHEKRYFYNDIKKLDKIETHRGGQMLSTFHLNYSNKGLVESFNTTGNEPTTFYEYDLNENVIKTISHLTDPWTGQESIQECKFVYDTKKKVNFGLDYLVGSELLPWRGTTSNWEQSLSKNNLISESCSGYEYTIEYEQNESPKSITTTWKDTETETPMTIRIEYRSELTRSNKF